MPESFIHIEKGDKITKEMLFAYLQGNMQDTERIHFEKLLSEDPFLQDAVEGLRGADMKEVENTLEGIFHDVDVITGAKKHISMPAAFRKYAVAAMILAFVGLTWLITNKLNTLQHQQQVAMEDNKKTEEQNVLHTDTGMGGGNMLTEDSDDTFRDTPDNHIASGTVNKADDETFTLKSAESIPGRSDQLESAAGKTDADIYMQEDMPVAVDDADVFAQVEENTLDGEGVYDKVEVSRVDEVVSGNAVTLSSISTKENKKKIDRAEKDSVKGNVTSNDAAGAPPATERKNTLAAFPGGNPALDMYFETHLQYPAGITITGEVIVGFTVNPDGSIFDAHIIQSLEQHLDAEALRLVNTMPNWIPANNAGVAVQSETELSIRFKGDH
ncbi:MAG: energy transducer TonB [Chitinophagales bacterium]